jgi:hypothetical protein
MSQASHLIAFMFKTKDPYCVAVGRPILAAAAFYAAHAGKDWLPTNQWNQAIAKRQQKLKQAGAGRQRRQTLNQFFAPEIFAGLDE